MAKTRKTQRERAAHASGDAVLTEIVRNGVVAVTEEMKSNLSRTAYNMIIYEALDFTVGLFTAKGETISIGLGLPTFIRGMAQTVQAKIAHFGLNGIEPGDILITNDAYITGSHLNHFTLSAPIFVGQKLVAWACCMAHWMDVGGILEGVTSDIYSEGLQVPIMKYQARGKVNSDLVGIIRMNVRLPERAMGDLRAQIVALHAGEIRFREMLARYGTQAVLQAIDQLMNQSEMAARRRLAKIPDGVYRAQAQMDEDLRSGERTMIEVAVHKVGHRMTIDLSNVGPQVRGFYNSGSTTGYACAQVAFKCLTSPGDYPINDGSFRPLTVKLVDGTAISAVRPAAMRWWMTYPMTVIDTIFRAMAPALPDLSIAGHHADLGATMLHGISPKDGTFFIGSTGAAGGGWGAKRAEDGVSATIAINNGDTHKPAIEQMEAKLPVLFERYSLRQDSGGAGRTRGGLGTEQVVRARSGVALSIQMDRQHCAPWGLDGGQPGKVNGVSLTRGSASEEQVDSKAFSCQLKAGEAFVVRSGGGGGHGDPFERDPRRVVHDVQQGYVSSDAALNEYGVVMSTDNQVDSVKTMRHRAARAQISISEPKAFAK